MNIEEIKKLWIIYIVMMTLFLCFQVLIKKLHSYKINGVYQVFLGVD
jgi:hypothetical protein